jgi:hypothetical protein
MSMPQSILVIVTWCGMWGVALSAPVEKTPWHEPEGVVEAAFLRDGKLRYSAEGHEIVGQNKTYFNNRPLYCELATTCFREALARRQCHPNREALARRRCPKHRATEPG